MEDIEVIINELKMAKGKIERLNIIRSLREIDRELLVNALTQNPIHSLLDEVMAVRYEQGEESVYNFLVTIEPKAVFELTSLINGDDKKQGILQKDLVVYLESYYGKEISQNPRIHMDGYIDIIKSFDSDEIKKAVAKELSNTRNLLKWNDVAEVIASIKDDRIKEKMLSKYKSSIYDEALIAKIVATIKNDNQRYKWIEKLQQENSRVYAITEAENPVLPFDENSARIYSYLQGVQSEENKARLISIMTDAGKERFLPLIRDARNRLIVISKFGDQDRKKDLLLAEGPREEVFALSPEELGGKQLWEILRIWYEDNVIKEGIEERQTIIDFSSDTLENFELFTRVFGKGFARSKMEELKYLLIGVPQNRNKGAFQLMGLDTMFFSEEVWRNRNNNLPMILHESIHQILKNNYWDGIATGTGVETIKDNYIIGTGLNEGLTEWMCMKAGYDPEKKSSALYGTLKRMVQQLELAVGDEKIMKLGKGGIEDNVPACLGLSQEDTMALLKQMDMIYQLYNTQNMNDYRRAVCEAESMIFERFFQKDFEEFKNNPNPPIEDIEKFKTLSSLMYSEEYYAYQSMPSIAFKNEFGTYINSQEESYTETVKDLRTKMQGQQEQIHELEAHIRGQNRDKSQEKDFGQID